MSSEVDPTRCPLCGADNSCGAQQGSSTCWCFSTRIPDDVLARIPAEARDRACVCQRCASSGQGDTEAPTDTKGLARDPQS